MVHPKREPRARRAHRLLKTGPGFRWECKPAYPHLGVIVVVQRKKRSSWFLISHVCFYGTYPY